MEQEGVDMQEVFEKIIEKLESEYEDIKEIYKRTKDMSFYFTFQGVNKAIEIVKKESEKSYHGHFGCNTNGEHERCDGCGLTNCKSRNKIWFGVGDDYQESNAWSNGWIPVSERLPEGRQDVLVCFDNIDGCIIAWYAPNGRTWRSSSTDNICRAEPIAWMNLPAPYQPKGE